MAQRIIFEKLTADGKGLSHWQEKALFAVGPLPGETAWMKIDRHHKTYVEASVKRFTETLPQRSPATEDHYLSCSPWQGVDYDYQLELKQGMLTDAFARQEVKIAAAVVGAPDRQHYRNKLEFSLRPGEDDKLQLAFHERGSVTELIAAPTGCILGTPAMNKAAIALLAKLNTLPEAALAQSIIVRQSQASKAVIGVVMVSESVTADWSKLGTAKLAGVGVARRVDHETMDLLWSQGTLELEETIGDLKLTYPWEAFFQVNPPAFAQALQAIAKAVKPGAHVLDLYGGVGTIGLSVAATAASVLGIEISPVATRLAEVNARTNNITNYQAMTSPSEHLDGAVFKDIDTVIVDPPRAGLHRRVIDRLLEVLPERIIYLSCNPITQARDLARLTEAYTPGTVTGFDFYPDTLHLESLVVLERR